MGTLSKRKVAILSENGFEQVELTDPKDALHAAGATVHVISPQRKTIKAWDEDQWGIEIPVDVNLSDANPDDYDALMIPGGVMNPDFMRKDKKCVAFVKAFFESGKPIASICHGPQLLIETGMLEGRSLTSYPSIKTDLINAGAKWEDKEVVVDEGLITSRSPADLPAFNKAMVKAFASGVTVES